MPITFNDFHRLATTAPKDTRDIVVNDAKTPQSVQLGNRVFSTPKKLNDATMAAFKDALQKEYGVFGLHAFDTVVGTRAQLHKSLRACDIKKIVSSLESLKQMRFTNELDRQLQTSPLLLQSGASRWPMKYGKSSMSILTISIICLKNARRLKTSRSLSMHPSDAHCPRRRKDWGLRKIRQFSKRSGHSIMEKSKSNQAPPPWGSASCIQPQPTEAPARQSKTM